VSRNDTDSAASGHQQAIVIAELQRQVAELSKRLANSGAGAVVKSMGLSPQDLEHLQIELDAAIRHNHEQNEV
jgi:hypothetical protein